MIMTLSGRTGSFHVSPLSFFLVVSILSFVVAWILNFLWSKVRKPVLSKKTLTENIFSKKVLSKKTPSKDYRAWIEIDLAALKHNARVLQELLPKQCKLMAVVKANAYGHGDITIAKTLNQLDIYAFAVATLEEGIHLRKNGIKGEILILGYTNPCDIDCLVHYRLTQTVVDCAYAKVLNDSGKKIKVHAKIDTGMHRLGVNADNHSEIESIFKYDNLMVEGVFSHLCVSDSLKDEDIIYTKYQFERFFNTVNFLISKGYSPGKLHIQASYGILNYPDLPCDFARAGIALYGVLSDNNKTHEKPDLRPVLSLKSRIAMVKEIESGESVSYGRQYIADNNMKIAMVTIGYADGIPRNISKSNSYVLLRGKKAPIIGRICMDQLVIDVTHIDTAEPGDIVTIIGRDGNEHIRCEDIAEKCGTISNEILSRLGSRLKHVIV
jgi:serine/alanine racemase